MPSFRYYVAIQYFFQNWLKKETIQLFGWLLYEEFQNCSVLVSINTFLFTLKYRANNAQYFPCSYSQLTV